MTSAEAEALQRLLIGIRPILGGDLCAAGLSGDDALTLCDLLGKVSRHVVVQGALAEAFGTRR